LPPASCLLLTMHHIISDGWSMSILIDELSIFYKTFCSSELPTANREPLLPPLPIQYADFAVWQRQWLQGEPLQEQIDYWKGRLSGATAQLELPTDRPRTSHPGFSGRNLHFRWPIRLLDSLNGLSRQQNATLYMTLLASFQVLLGRWSGQQDISIGTPIANRNRSETEGLIGFFVNTLVMRCDLSGHPRFADLLVQARETALQAYAHQDVPFEQIVETLQPERSLDREPLFQVMLALQNAPMPEIDLPGLKVVPQLIDLPTAHFDLTVALVEGEAGLEGVLIYNSRLFDPTTAHRLCRHFRTLLEAAAAKPQARVGDLPLWGEAERHQVLVEWNPPGSCSEQDWCGGLSDRFEQRVQQHPDSVAAVFSPVGSWQLAVGSPDAKESSETLDLGPWTLDSASPSGAYSLQPTACSLSYSSLSRHSRRIAAWLVEKGVGPEVRVGIAMEPSLEMLIAILGVLKAGGTYLPLDTSYPAQRQAFMLEDAQAPLVLRSGSGGEFSSQSAVRSPQSGGGTRNTEQGAGSRSPLRSGVSGDGVSGGSPFLAPSGQGAAYVIYTSGSTGRPKGVVVSHRNAVRLFQATRHWFSFGRDDVWTLFHSHAFDFSVWEMWGALLHGGRLVVVPRDVRRSPRDFAQLLLQEQVTVLNQTPSAFRQLQDSEGPESKVEKKESGVRKQEAGRAESRIRTLEPEAYSLQPTAYSLPFSLLTVILGGEALDVASLRPWLERFGDQPPRLVNMYGITETTVHVTCRPITADDLQKPGSRLGIPIEDLQAFLLDRGLQPVPLGVAGEICVGGEGLARGYLRRPGLTAQRFIPHAWAERPGERLYRSGDLGRWRPEGDLEYLGRIDRQIKMRGFRIELGEIEASLKSHPDVHRAVVVEKGGQLAAFIMKEAGGRRQEAGRGDHGKVRSSDGGDGAEPSDSEAYSLPLLDFLKQRLPEYMIPANITVLEELPLTPNGKLDREALLAEAPQQLGSERLAPGTRLEKLLAEIWAQVLGVEEVGIRDNFFDLGGHSMLIPLVLSQLEESLGRKVSILHMFEQPTVEALAQALEVEGDSPPDPETDAASDPVPDRVAARKDFFRRRRLEGVSRQDAKSAKFEE
ncbi:MAG: AMP-binding protein, partial [Acidobacteriota bacterium]